MIKFVVQSNPIFTQMGETLYLTEVKFLTAAAAMAYRAQVQGESKIVVVK